MSATVTVTGVAPRCRFCDHPLTRTVVDLGRMPLANSFLDVADLAHEEQQYPLRARVCDQCQLVQVDDVVPPEAIFGDYAYFSSYSDSWVDHARRFATSAIHDLGLSADSLVVEVASNDGYLLRHFRDAGVPVLGIEPAANVAEVALEAGIPTDVRFFGADLASELVADGRRPDLLVANNVLAHVPGLNDFVAGLSILLAADGVLAIEVPHLLRLVQEVQFDTIYHEHYSYFSLRTVERVLEAHGLAVFDVERLPTHGGSLRLWVAHAASGRTPGDELRAVRALEEAAGLFEPASYATFAGEVERCRDQLLEFLATARKEGDPVVAYGAAAKGNTLLNFCGVGPSDLEYVVDLSPHKQGRFLPGSRLPIRPPTEIARTKPRYLLILPWNLRNEIRDQMSEITGWGGRFVTAIPRVEVFG